MINFIKQEMYGWNKGEIAWLIIAPSIILGLSLYWGDTLMGIISAVTGVLCVILTAKGKISCFFWGTINTVLYALIAYQSKYYGDFMLNMFYFLPFQFIGIYMWKKNMEDANVKMKKMTVKQLLMWAVICIVAIIGYGFTLKNMGGALPFVDSTSTVLSVWAMFVSVKRYTEQWLAWIAIDIVTIIMWAVAFAIGGDNIATLAMWVVYLANAVYGYIHWLKNSKEGNSYEI